MNMNKQDRVENIKKVIEENKNNPFGIQQVRWKGRLQSMEVYEVPLEYLVYHKKNGRILSRTKSLEKQNKEIDIETAAGKERIEELLWESNVRRNKITLENIARIGQEKVGYITRDGIIIDGNRRAMLLNDIRNDGKLSKKSYLKREEFNYFKAVVLPVTREENPLEIQKLEISLQMGEDEKLGYNSIEKNLKVKDIYQSLTQKPYSDKEPDKKAIEEIAEKMGEEKSKIKEYLQVMKTMDEYLDYMGDGYEGMYTQLDDRVDSVY